MALLDTLARTVPGNTSFEPAAHALLRAYLGETARLLAETQWAERGEILRAMLHLRPGGEWRGLVVVPNAHVEPPDGSLAPSLSTWKRVVEDRSPVAVDVLAGTLSSRATIRRLLARDVSHILALPLRMPGGGDVQGMVVVEAACPIAMGQPFCWDTHLDALQAALDLAAPTLLTLPLEPGPVLRDDPLLPIVGSAMASLVSLLDVFAQQQETILVSGPTGAGKSRLAAWIHARSSRAEAPFETLELLSVPEPMQMGELFGWRRGAFTGAVRDQTGAIGRADGGTLFLDEIDKLSLAAQAGLLQLLETRTWRPLGDAGPPRRADVRFVVGTNTDLAGAVREGRFREDLYYRINVLPVRVPPLSERVDEVDAWAAFMLRRRHAEAGGDGPAVLTADVGAALRSQSWPGNLRQLDNVIRRSYAIAMADGARAVERRHVERALGLDSGAKAAGALAVMRRAASAFVDEAVRLQGSPDALDLDDATAFRGLVLEAARESTGSVRDAFVLLGREGVVRNRNHSKEFRKEEERAGELVRRLRGGIADG